MRKAARYLALTIVVFLTILPVLWVVKIALSGSNTFQGAELSPIPSVLSASNFLNVVGTHDAQGNWLFGRQLLNSVMVSVLTTLVGITVACTAAYAFSRFRFEGRRAGLFMFLVSQMFPGILMMVPLYVIMQRLHLLDTMIGLVLIYGITSVPFSVWMLKGYFDTIPKDLEEAAVMDGASPARVFWSVVLPLSMPAVAITALFSFMTAWNEFVLAYTFLSEETAFTLPVIIRNYVGEHTVQWGFFAAASIIVSVPVVALFFSLQRYLVGGLTAGGVKT
ncbi:MAG: sugar ABC transporter permease [Deltaproteobacteria bacterium]|nr:sugar ABC transporter permease [Deltaproteobacteria bacterium]